MKQIYYMNSLREVSSMYGSIAIIHTDLGGAGLRHGSGHGDQTGRGLRGGAAGRGAGRGRVSGRMAGRSEAAGRDPERRQDLGRLEPLPQHAGAEVLAPGHRERGGGARPRKSRRLPV